MKAGIHGAYRIISSKSCNEHLIEQIGGYVLTIKPYEYKHGTIAYGLTMSHAVLLCLDPNAPFCGICRSKCSSTQFSAPMDVSTPARRVHLSSRDTSAVWDQWGSVIDRAKEAYEEPH